VILSREKTFGEKLKKLEKDQDILDKQL